MAIMDRASHRRGLSLLEVLVAMAIFLFALVALGHLVTQAGNRALDVQQKSQAIQICKAKLAELAAGAIPLESQGDVPLDEDPSWHWSLDAEQGNVSGLWNVSVRVTKQQASGSKIEVALNQMMLDPSLRGNNQVGSLVSSESSSSSNSQSNSGSNNTPAAAASGAAPTNGSKNTPASSNSKSNTPSTPSKPATSTPAPAASAPAASKPAASAPAPAAPKATPAPASSAPKAAPGKGGA